jgi:hypothetical protein
MPSSSLKIIPSLQIPANYEKIFLLVFFQECFTTFTVAPRLISCLLLKPNSQQLLSYAAAATEELHAVHTDTCTRSEIQHLLQSS